jgi:hypothetical protein
MAENNRNNNNPPPRKKRRWYYKSRPPTTPTTTRTTTTTTESTTKPQHPTPPPSRQDILKQHEKDRIENEKQVSNMEQQLHNYFHKSNTPYSFVDENGIYKFTPKTPINPFMNMTFTPFIPSFTPQTSAIQTNIWGSIFPFQNVVPIVPVPPAVPIVPEFIEIRENIQHIDDLIALCEKYPLSETLEAIRKRWIVVMTLQLKGYTKFKIVNMLVKDFELSEAQAYNDVRNAENIFGNINKTDNEGVQTIDTKALSKGTYLVKIDWKIGDKKYFKEERLNIH